MNLTEEELTAIKQLHYWMELDEDAIEEKYQLDALFEFLGDAGLLSKKGKEFAHAYWKFTYHNDHAHCTLCSNCIECEVCECEGEKI